MDGVLRVVPHPKLDIALLTATRSDVVAFPDFGAPTWGAEVSVVGYPEDLYLDDQGEPRPRARLLKGHIQRIESSADEADRRGDLELSFACPGGLSGAPVVLQGGQIVVGVVIGNRDSSTTENSTETLRGAETVTREVARYVSFGAAVDLSRATPWLDTVLK
jgi:hypothetical protein